MAHDRTIPHLIAAHPGQDISATAAMILNYGAVLLRGFALESTGLPDALTPVLGPLLPYAGGVGFKSALDQGVYRSTEVDRRLTISPHSELAYTNHPPRFLAFWCGHPARAGGETSLVCARAVHRRLSPQTRRAFEQRGICYRRQYPPHRPAVRALNTVARVWPSWPMVFETSHRADAEAICTRLGLEYRWSPDGTLTTLCHQPGTQQDASGHAVWLHQAHTFCPSPAANGWLLYQLAHALRRLPPLRQATCTFGDGTPIPQPMLREIMEAIKAHQTLVSWQAGDLLLIDNTSVLHGRLPYRGPRDLRVAMGNGPDHGARST